MRKLVFLAIVLGIFIFAGCASATTYYISFSTGSNSNDGLTKATAWKTHPYMQSAGGCTGSGSAPSYSHSAGDQFIFKQGDSWPNACFEMTIQAGGAPGNPDVYTFDPTWGTPGGTTGNLGQAVGTYQFNAGGAVISGAGGLNRFVYDNAHDNIVFNGVEMVGMTWSGSGGSFGNVHGVDIQTSQNFVLSNCYFHGWTHPGASSDNMDWFVGNANAPHNAGSRLTGCVIDGANSGGAGVSDSGSATFAIPLADNNIIRNMSNGILTNANAVVHDNLIGPINLSFDSSDHENCIEPIDMIPGGTSTNYFYNNVWHDCTAVGILTQGAAPSSGIEIDYLWNNVAYVGSVSSPPIPFQFDSVSTSNSSSEIHAWNNTIYGGTQDVCMRTIGRGNGNFGVLDIQNNHCISDGGLISTGPSGNTFKNNNNVVVNTSTAASQGFKTTGTFAYAPPSSSSPTVGAGANLTGLASGNFATLAKDTTYGGIRSANSRPSSGAWDAGAYQFSSSTSSGAPAPPTNVKVLSVQ
jgi:hypothetical protein